MMKITEEILLNNKFERTSIDYVSIFNRVVYNEMGAVKYSIDMRKGLSNMFGRDWVCHLDNDFFETIGSVDIDTVEQFNMFMELMEVPYKLTNI